MKSTLFRKYDFLIIAAVLALSALVIFTRAHDSGGRVAVVSVNSEVICEIDLDSAKGREVITPETEPEVTIVAENGEIFFENSQCRDKICVKSGRLSKAGDIAVCLPAKTVVSITGSGPDAVTY